MTTIFSGGHREGFTLIEALVAIAILTLSVAGPLVTASRATVAAQNSSNFLTATYLAQEGLEQVRAMRDNEYLYDYSGSNPSSNSQTAGGPRTPATGAPTSGFGWYDFVGDPPGFGAHPGIEVPCLKSYCSLDATQNIGYPGGIGPNSGTSGNVSLTQCTGGACPVLNLMSNGFYSTQSGGTAKSFIRTINVVPVSPTDEFVISNVRWSFHGTLYQVSATVHLTPWQ